MIQDQKFVSPGMNPKDEIVEGEKIIKVFAELWLNKCNITGNHTSQVEDEITFNEKLSCF